MGEVINPIKCSIQQFYGIEINDFAVTVAKTALWIAESQMMKETENIVHMNLDFLPLTTNATIIEGNALRLDWRYLHEEEKTPTIQAKKTNLISEYDLTPGMPIVVAEPGMVYGEVNLITEELHVGKAKADKIENHYNYIMGNPPFVGFKFANAAQKDDMKAVFMNAIKPALLDYVCCWYKKAAEYKIHINFAWRSFVWQSESSEAAKVHVVIIGFSNTDRKEKVLYTGSSSRKVTNISPYLIEGDNILITSRRDPLCDIPKMVMGNQAMDGGNLIIEEKDYEDFVTREPKALPYIKRYMMGYEFINNKKRYCLWLVNCPPEILRSMPLTMERVKAVREMRSSSNDAGARKKADTPMLFREQRNPKNFIAIPIVSSEKRRYIPIGYLDDSVIAGNKLFIVPDATLYHFGVLTSNVHMAWVRTVASRLKSDYTYSKDVVYNNFPWCQPTDEQRIKIEETAQMILDARAKYPDSSLADLYDDLTMPPELRKAHQENDRAVMRAYGFSIKDTTESSCVAALMKLYQEKTAES